MYRFNQCKNASKISDKYSVLLGSFKAAAHATNDADCSITSSDNKLVGRQKAETGNALAESLLLWSDKLECV